jgi:predicted metal-dependent hydrolase
MRGIRVRVKSGDILISAPKGASQKVITDYVNQLRPWLREHIDKAPALADGDVIWNNLRLALQNAQVTKVSIQGSQLVVSGPDIKSRQKTLEKFLVKQAKQILPERLSILADVYDIDYSECKIRKLSARWGSCSSKRVITLNYMLVTLPEPLRDYVIYHELSHLKHLDHSSEFWSQVSKYCTDYKSYRKQLKQRPAVLRLS